MLSSCGGSGMAGIFQKVPQTTPAKMTIEKETKEYHDTGELKATTTLSVTLVNDANSLGGMNLSFDQYGNPAAGTGGSREVTYAKVDVWYKARIIGAMLLGLGAMMLIARFAKTFFPFFGNLPIGVSWGFIGTGGGLIAGEYLSEAARYLVIGGVIVLMVVVAIWANEKLRKGAG